jgi:signal transduction histidine kinase
MACPLRLDKRVVGVLFAGQILTNPAPGSWQQALGQIRDLVAWETVPDTANQADDVIAAIQHRPELSSNDKSQLEQVLEMEAQRCDRNVPVDTLLDRFAKFREFAEMMQCLIARLHAANVLAAGQQLAQRCAEVLAGLDLHQPEQWVAQASTMVDTLRQLAPIKSLHAYRRRASRFEQLIPAPPAGSRPQRIPVRDVLQRIPPNQFTDAALESWLPESARSGTPDAPLPLWSYRTQTDSSGSLLILEGEIPQELIGTFSLLSRSIAFAVDIASLVFAQMDSQTTYRIAVADIGHSFRTPLQAVLFDLDFVAKQEALIEDAELQARLLESADRVLEAKEDVHALIEGAEDKSSEFEFAEVVQRVVRIMTPIADRRPCKIVADLSRFPKAPVRANRYRVRRALTCLMDNAVKYSYDARLVAGRWTLYEVRVSIELQDEHVLARISNYGVGIPPEKLAALKTPRFRGKVPDARYFREGFGLGLPYAIHAFEQQGGYVDVESTAADSDPREEDEQYHRYLTTVCAALPIVLRKDQT